MLVKLAPLVGLVDHPSPRKIHEQVIPRIGGIAIIIGALIPVLLWVPLQREILSYIAAVLLLALFGALDDRHDLDYRVKFASQIGAALIFSYFGGVAVHHFPFVPGEVLPDWLSIPVTVLVLVAVTNAINLSDGMDGLAGGTSLLVLGFWAILGYQAGDSALVMLALAIAGGTIGFLRFNTHPARIFMGDCGSQFLGFSAGVLALMVTQDSNTALSPLLPILVFGLPILDTGWVMIRRIYAGRSPFSPDRGHIHHRMLDLGLSQYESVVLIYGVQILLLLIAYALAYSWDLLIAIVFTTFALSVIQILKLAHAKSLAGGTPFEHRTPSIVTRFVTVAKHQRLMIEGPYQLINLLVPTILVAGAFLATEVDFEYAILSLVLLGSLIITLKVKFLPFFLLERLAVFTAAACVIYLLQSSDWLVSAGGRYLYLPFILLALLVAIWVRFAGSQFRLNPMDFLIVSIVLILPFLPGFQQNRLGVIAIEIMILFYAAEVLISSRERHWDNLRIGVIFTLAILTVRGLGVF